MSLLYCSISLHKCITFFISGYSFNNLVKSKESKQCYQNEVLHCRNKTFYFFSILVTCRYWHISDKAFHFNETTIYLKSWTQYRYWFYDIWLLSHLIWHLPLSQVIITFLSLSFCFLLCCPNVLLLLQMPFLFHIFQVLFPQIVWLIRIIKLSSQWLFPGCG